MHEWIQNVTAIFDGQFGSTGKGAIASYLASDYRVHVRVGAPNAGHTHIYKGVKWVNQSVPVGWVNPLALLVIGRGALINPEILAKEVYEIEKVDPTIRQRLSVDAKAGIISSWHIKEEGHTSGELHHRIGSTGEGVGAARIDRIRRDPLRFQMFEDVAEMYGLSDLIDYDTPELLQRHNYDRFDKILLEGAQGSGLDLIHSYWPYCTSNGCGVAQMAADIGIPPRAIANTIMVIRTFPIRVAGTSGPLPNETSWDAISEKLGREVIERTTVTKKVRRIARWDWGVVDRAVLLNAPNSIALNFADYFHPDNEGVENYIDLTDETKNFILEIEERYNVPVAFVGTGGPKLTLIDRR